MKSPKYNIYISGLLAAAITLGGCADEIFVPDSPNSIGSDKYVTYSAAVSTGAAITSRAAGEEKLYEPLELNADDCDFPVYLHTYVHPIGHNPFKSANAASRGEQIQNEADFVSIAETFAVDAYNKDKSTQFFNWENTHKLSNDNKIWNTKAPHQWPGNDELSFHAIAPYDHRNQLEIVELGDKSITFKYSAKKGEEGKMKDAEAQVDLLAAVATINRDGTKEYENRVPFVFSHALSAIKFAVRDVLKGEVVSISIGNVKGSGRCVYTASSNNTEGTFNWTPSGVLTRFDQLFNVKIDDGVIDPADDKHDVLLNKKGDEKTFFMIPQEIPEGAYIELEIERTNLETPPHETQNPPKKRFKLRGKIDANDIKEWRPGYEYIYTISTTKDNWVYVFDVSGSVQNEETGAFSDDEHNIIVNPTVTKGAYYNVQSYRYRANDFSKNEPVEWSAETSHGKNTTDNATINGFIQTYKAYIPAMDLDANDWFPDQHMETFGGNGSVEETKYDVTFKSQYVATDYEGDWKMRSNKPLGSETAPIDLSMRNGGAGVGRNTANCYIVNRGGWYSIPLYYGNAIKNGVSNPSAYTNDRSDPLYNVKEYSAADFVNHNGKPITDAPIADVFDATLVWEDAYNIIDQNSVKIQNVGGEDMLVFKVIQDDLQQSNSILAVRDASGTILWSWHLWVSDYWIQQSTDYNKIDDNTDLVLTEGLIECQTIPDVNTQNESNIPEPARTSFTATARNLGWCDAKNVIILKRTGTIEFTQSGNPQEPKHILNVLQRPKEIVYWIGNNTYYQWGRKDPMVGFCNVDNQLKTNWGPIPYDVKDSEDATAPGSIVRGIKEPNHLLVHKNTDSGSIGTNDWIHTGDYTFYNLWNNYQGTEDIITNLTEWERERLNWQLTGAIKRANCYIYTSQYAYSAVKTVYDPSPAGFLVPPSTFFNVFVNGRADCDYSNNNTTLTKGFNGDNLEKIYIESEKNRYPGRYFNWYAYSKPNKQGDKILLTPTGQRWDCAYHKTLDIVAGQNMNPHLVYLWTNNAIINTSAVRGGNANTGYSFALGYEGDINADEPIVSTTHFNARKSMARPIRAIKEF